MAGRLNLVYALRGDELVYVSDVERGLKCGCRCPACNGELVARKGEKKAHHFAHHNADTCAYGYETSLHLAAKDILLHAGKLDLPLSHDLLSGKIRKELCDDMWTNGGEITIDNVELEKKFGSVIPDVIIHSGSRVIFVEIYVTHPIDDKKLQKLRELKIPTIEVNLSNMDDSVSREQLEHIILHGYGIYRYWKYDPIAEEYLDKCYAMSRQLWTNWNSKVLCPTKQRRVSDDVCFNCKYNYGISKGSFVLCSGKERVRKYKKSSTAKISVPVIENPIPASKPEPVKESERKTIHETVKEPEPEIVKEPEPEKPSWKLTELAEQMYLKLKNKKPGEEVIGKWSPGIKTDWKTVETTKTIEAAKNILSRAASICLPDLGDIAINGTDFNDGISGGMLHTDAGDIVLLFYFNRHDAVTLPEGYPVLGINLDISKSCVTVKKFEEALIYNKDIKQWMRKTLGI